MEYLYFKPRRSITKCGSGGDVAGTAKKHQEIAMETKVKIIERMKQGKRMVDIACFCTMNHSTIGTILKNKDKIMEHTKSVVYRTRTRLWNM